MQWKEKRRKIVNLFIMSLSRQSISSSASLRLIHAGFSLVELLVVIAIIALIAFVAGPAIESLGSAGGFAKAVGAVSMSLTEARSYAMANNTHVFVGLEETDASQGNLVAPQTPGIGRLFLAVGRLD